MPRLPPGWHDRSARMWCMDLQSTTWAEVGVHLDWQCHDQNMLRLFCYIKSYCVLFGEVFASTDNLSSDILAIMLTDWGPDDQRNRSIPEMSWMSQGIPLAFHWHPISQIFSESQRRHICESSACERGCINAQPGEAHWVGTTRSCLVDSNICLILLNA
jgi:hypothetical protein